MNQDGHARAQQLLWLFDDFLIWDALRAVLGKRHDLHTQGASLVSFSAEYPCIDVVINLQQHALQEDLRDTDQSLHFDRIPERIILWSKPVHHLEPLLLTPLQEVAHHEHSILKRLERPFEELNAITHDRSRDIDGPTGPVAQLAVHLCLQAVGPLQLCSDEIGLLHKRHGHHQLLLELLHAELQLPVVLLLGRGPLRLPLQLLDPLLRRLLSLSLAIFKLLL
mmetsp:Transcript_50835/g.147571  ORF Transcript_50835/g.147571 Transcript_50835/m.147571 type:complete len:223 (-) Transcript_50835:2157-2825(-)